MKTQETYYRNVVAAAKLLTRMEVDNETDEYQPFSGPHGDPWPD
ncbi:hypothetical protein [Secundilactobacillus similis]|nr:hypothetical protein [Secundilactobacillus similis]